PTGSGLGGGGFWLLHRADGFETLVDGREVAPLSATRDMYLDARGVADPKRSTDGALAAAIPGEPAALAHLAQKYGTLPLAELLAPAQRFAHDGFAVDRKLADAIARNAARFSGEAAEVFAPGGSPLQAGDLLRQPQLADTLTQLGADADAFYRGAWGQRWTTAVRAAGGIWSDADLRGYRVVERTPAVTWFRDWKITSAPPPSAGGIALTQVLQMLESLGAPLDAGPRTEHLVIEALRRAYADRQRHLGDPGFVTVPHRLSAREYNLALVRGIDPAHATPSDKLNGGGEGGNTTHFSVLDAAGNRVAGTLSINLPFGSAAMVGGTGVLLNDEMDDFAASVTASNAYGLAGSQANMIAAGKRPLSSMSPTFVEGPNGLLITGTPGGSRIVSMVLLAIASFVQDLDVAQIAALGRYHHQYLPDVVEFEPGALPPEHQAALQAAGHVLRATGAPYGNLNSVLWNPRRDVLAASADPRGVGTSAVKRIVKASADETRERP
ncbi:MAG TPA: gamma-glutamyltransferase, partial [Candidatus Binatia bacterium]|nr:gamma-glutamyltransferase [Candidatus Binatia bacterium]